jgi:hypothetical protein
LLISRKRLYGGDERKGFGGTWVQILTYAASSVSYVKATVKSAIIINSNDDSTDKNR